MKQSEHKIMDSKLTDEADILLATVSRHSLSLECSCGHVGVVNVQNCLVTFGLRATVADVATGTRCGECGKNNVAEFKVVYSS